MPVFIVHGNRREEEKKIVGVGERGDGVKEVLEKEGGDVCLFVGWLLNVPATG